MDYQVLADELNNDPLGRGYSGMDNSQAADDINSDYVVSTKALTVGEFEEALRHSTKYMQFADRAELKDDQGDSTYPNISELMRSLSTRVTEMDFRGELYWNDLLDDCVAEGSIGTGAADAIKALCDITISRGTDLEIGTVTAADVSYARSL